MESIGLIRKKLHILKKEAPIEKGEVVAKMEYEQDGKMLGEVEIVAVESVGEQKYHHALEKLFWQYLNIY